MQDTSTFSSNDEDPFLENHKRVGKWCKKWQDRDVLSEEITNWEVMNKYKPANLYGNTKTHSEGWPYRFIMSSKGTATENLERWIEYHLKGELQRENKFISYERAFKMLENDMYIAGIGQVVLELLSFKVESGNHQRGISLLQKFSDIFGNMRLVPLKMTSHLTSHNFQILKIEIFSKLCKI